MPFHRRAAVNIPAIAISFVTLACAGSAAARPGRLAPKGIELLAPTTITISNFPIDPLLVFQLVRQMYAEEGVTLPAAAEGDTLLVSPPVARGAYEIVYRVRLHPGERRHLVSLDALYRIPGDSVTYVLTQDARGELGRVWNGQLRVTRKLFERRFGKCCVYGAASSEVITDWSLYAPRQQGNSGTQDEASGERCSSGRSRSRPPANQRRRSKQDSLHPWSA